MFQFYKITLNNLMAKRQHQKEEKLMTFYYKAVDFFEKNKKHVYTSLTILVLSSPLQYGILNTG